MKFTDGVRKSSFSVVSVYHDINFRKSHQSKEYTLSHSESESGVTALDQYRATSNQTKSVTEASFLNSKRSSITNLALGPALIKQQKL